VAAVVASSHAGPAGPPFARYHQQGDNVFEVEAGFPCTEPISAHGFVEASTLPGGPAACTTYTGPYDGIGAAHDALRTWIESHHGRVVGDPWDVYLDSPVDQPDPTHLRTQVIQPFERVSRTDTTDPGGEPTLTHRQLTAKVRDVMTTTVVTATVHTPLPALVDLMVRARISGVPILDEQSHLVGIVTEADLISKPAYGGTRRRPLGVLGDIIHGRENMWAKKAKGLAAGDVMTTIVETARPKDDLRTVARRMVDCGVKRLPVVADGRVVGIVSRPDVLRAMHRTDQELEQDIVAVISDPMREPDTTLVDVTVNDGVVRLAGTVQYPMDIPVLSAIVWRFPGVVDVRNEVTATGPDPKPPSSQSSMTDYGYLGFFR
jgi:CBS domain-containing protein/effector-binding domain-containing protein